MEFESFHVFFYLMRYCEEGAGLNKLFVCLLINIKWNNVKWGRGVQRKGRKEGVRRKVWREKQEEEEHWTKRSEDEGKEEEVTFWKDWWNNLRGGVIFFVEELDKTRGWYLSIPPAVSTCLWAKEREGEEEDDDDHHHHHGRRTEQMLWSHRAVF